MKLLIITPIFPYPLESGGNKAQFLMIDKLRQNFEISLICPKTNTTNLARLSELWADVNINVLTVVDEIPAKKTGLIQRVFIRFSNLFRHPVSSIKRKLGLLPKAQPAALNWPSRENMVYNNLNIMDVNANFLSYVDTKIKNTQFDIIQVEFINFISLSFILPKDVITLFIHHEIGYIRTAREMDTLSAKNSYDNYLYESNKAFEIECLKRYNGVITFSEVDKAELEKYIKTPVFNSPFPVKEQPLVLTDSFKFEKIVFLGGESHYPNVDGLNWFLRSYTENHNQAISIKIIGKWSTAVVEYYKNMKNVEFLGYVDDLNEYLINSVMIVPLRIGSGIRTKILEAFAWGVPVISTTIGIEGISAIAGKHYYKADTIEELTSAMDEIIKFPEIAAEKAESAKKEVMPYYTTETCCDIRENVYKFYLEKLSIKKNG